MKKAPGIKGAAHDPWLNMFVEQIRKHIIEKNDDRIDLIVGPTGTGKSNLALYIMDIYLGDRANIDLCGLDKPGIATALKKAKDMDKPRMAWLDEANINKREALTRFNRDMIDLFMAIRGLGIYGVWCNPSLDMIDKPFIEERINGFYLTPAKNEHARPYYFFSRDAILQILHKHKKLTVPILKKEKHRHAYYKGWFTEYNGILKQPYLDKKNKRMGFKIEKFFEKYGNCNDKKTVKMSEVAKMFGLSKATILNYINFHKDKLIPGEHYNKNIAGWYFFTEKGVEMVKNIAESKKSNSRKKSFKYNKEAIYGGSEAQRSKQNI